MIPMFLLNGQKESNYPACPDFVLDRIRKTKKAEQLLQEHQHQDVYINVCMTCGSFGFHRAELIKQGVRQQIQLHESKMCQGCMKMATLLPFFAALGKVITFQAWLEVAKHEHREQPPSQGVSSENQSSEDTSRSKTESKN